MASNAQEGLPFAPETLGPRPPRIERAGIAPDSDEAGVGLSAHLGGALAAG